MLRWLPASLKGALASVIVIVNTLFWAILIYVFALLKFLIPLPGFRLWCRRVMVAIAENWIAINSLEARAFHDIKWDIQGTENLSYDRSYLVCANHQSWVDIVVLQTVLNRRIPFLRFFLKRELAYVPLLGLAWWALDFPFMRRYSKEFLAKNPHMRGKDLETTKQACERFRGMNISILNFLEGTRLTRAKHEKSRSPFRNLLPPKTGGIAFVLQTMGQQFDALLDVTLFYPEGSPTFWDLLSGRMNEVVVRIRRIEIPQAFLEGNYLEQDDFRESMQAWVRDLWTSKDQLLDTLKRTHPAQG